MGFEPSSVAVIALWTTSASGNIKRWRSVLSGRLAAHLWHLWQELLQSKRHARAQEDAPRPDGVSRLRLRVQHATAPEAAPRQDAWHSSGGPASEGSWPGPVSAPLCSDGAAAYRYTVRIRRRSLTRDYATCLNTCIFRQVCLSYKIISYLPFFFDYYYYLMIIS